MAFILQEGFEGGATGWTYGKVAGPNSTAGRYPGGRWCLGINGNNSNFYGYQDYYATKDFPATKTFTIGFDMNLVLNAIYGPDNPIPIMVLRSGSNVNIAVYIRYNSRVGKYYATCSKTLNSSAIIATSALIENFSQYGYNHYDLEFDAGIAGFARFYINGKLVLNVSATNFAGGGTVETSSNILFYAPQYIASNSAEQQVWYDNLYIIDSPTRIGEVNIVALRPSADTELKNWTPSTGVTNYNMVNTLAYSTTQTTNVSAKSTARDLYELPNLNTVTSMDGKIHAVTSNGYGYKTTAGTVPVRTVVNSNNATFLSSSNTVNEGQANSKQISGPIYVTNPSNGLPWTVSDIDGLRSGIDITLNQDFALIVDPDGNIVNNSSSSIVAGDVPPTVDSTGSLVFTGTQRLRYTDSPQFRAAPPFSIEFEFQTASNATQQIFNIGGDLITIFPELELCILSGSLVVRTTNSSNVTTQTTIIPTVALSTWYKVGIMLYANGSATWMKVFLNGTVVTDVSISAPYDSTGGTGIGGSINLPEYFTGKLRNLRVSNSLLWDTGKYPNLLYQIKDGIINNRAGTAQTSANAPTYNAGGWLDFNGTNQRLVYTNTGGVYNITSLPYSIEFDVYSTVSYNGAPRGCMWMAVGFDETSTGTSAGQVRIGPWVTDNVNACVNSANNVLVVQPFPINTWMTIGVMFYNNGVNRVRTYYNGVQVTDVPLTMSTINSNPMSIGNSFGTDPYWMTGRIRNLYIGRSLFWPI